MVLKWWIDAEINVVYLFPLLEIEIGSDKHDKMIEQNTMYVYVRTISEMSKIILFWDLMIIFLHLVEYRFCSPEKVCNNGPLQTEAKPTPHKTSYYWRKPWVKLFCLQKFCLYFAVCYFLCSRCRICPLHFWLGFQQAEVQLIFALLEITLSLKKCHCFKTINGTRVSCKMGSLL